MRARTAQAILIGLTLVVFCSASSGSELKTRYATILYQNEDHLRRFNKEIPLGSLSYLLRGKKSITTDDEIRNKIDVLIERVEAILEMFPKDLKFSLSLLSSDDEVQGVYRSKYARNADYIAFYSPGDRTIFVSVKDIDTGILAHEIAHVIIDLYYGMSTPTKIHEVLAQYVETHLRD
jgi:hypothetical protein